MQRLTCVIVVASLALPLAGCSVKRAPVAVIEPSYSHLRQNPAPPPSFAGVSDAARLR